MTKRCTACGEVKSLDDFYFIQKRKTHHVYCQPCNLEYQRQYREKHAEQSKLYKRQYYLDHREEILAKDRLRKNPEVRLRSSLKRHYGITPEDYRTMVDAQGGLCAICGQPCPDRGRLSVDHDHATGQIRGLLCSVHNVGLGMFGDDPDLLIAAAEYLRASR